MFTKKLIIVKNDSIIIDAIVMPILVKPHFFITGDTFLLFGSHEFDENFSIPKRSQVFLNDKLLGLSDFSGTLNVKSDRYTGMLHAVYLN